MKKLVLACLALFLLVAAKCGADQQFVESMDRPAKLLLPDLQKVYDAEPDAKISDVLPHLKGDAVSTNKEKRDRRLLLLREWRKNIESAKEESRLPFDPRVDVRTVRYDDGLIDRVK